MTCSMQLSITVILGNKQETLSRVQSAVCTDLSESFLAPPPPPHTPPHFPFLLQPCPPPPPPPSGYQLLSTRQTAKLAGTLPLHNAHVRGCLLSAKRPIKKTNMAAMDLVYTFTGYIDQIDWL